MSHTPSSSKVEPGEVERLTQTVAALDRQVRTQGLILDEIREDLVGAVRNERLACSATGRGQPGVPPRPVKSLEEEAVARENRTSAKPSIAATDSTTLISPQNGITPPSARPVAVSGNTTLKDRMFEHPLYIEIVRILGYGGMVLKDFHEKGKLLVDTYGPAAAQEAAEAITRIDASSEPAMLYLNDKARSWAWSTLGPDPQKPQWWSEAAVDSPAEPSAGRKKAPRYRTSLANETGSSSGPPPEKREFKP